MVTQCLAFANIAIAPKHHLVVIMYHDFGFPATQSRRKTSHPENRVQRPWAVDRRAIHDERVVEFSSLSVERFTGVSRQELSDPSWLSILDNEIGHSHSVASLARRVGVSRNHLTRLFRQHLQTTTVDYLQGRRMKQVRHLIEHSCLPIKLIAEEVGLSDLHQFNKFFKKRTGLSPRAYRSQYAQSLRR